MPWTQNRGEHNGRPGTWYSEQAHGGPGNYPYTIRHFVADADRRPEVNVNPEKPWESFPHFTET